MTPPEQQRLLQEHIQALAKILYEDTSAEQLTTLAGIEQAVQPNAETSCLRWVFLSQQLQAQRRTPAHPQKLGVLPLTNQQAQHLGCAHTTESVSRVVLFVSECQCILPAC